MHPKAITTPAVKRPDYLFVDAVRFWSMLGVVAQHASQWIDAKPSEGVLPLALVSLCKYGTIGFFLISGFLLGDRMETAAPLPYLTRRLKTLLIPWAFWFCICWLYLIAGDMAHERVAMSSAASWSHMAWAELLQAAFSTSFWFVPNLALSMCILMLFRRYLYSVWLGAALFAVNLLYVADIYGEWFSPRHSSAFFAFVSFLWLGSYAARNFSRVSGLINRIPLALVIALTGLAYLASLTEAQILAARHSADPINTLRLSNQIFSVLVVLLICKLKSASWPSFIHVREQTFSIYLLHTFFLRIGSVLLNHSFHPGFVENASPALSFLLRAYLFIFSYGGSLLAGRFIAQSSAWRWTIGLKTREERGVLNKLSTAPKTALFGHN